jgi:hypothetical protein
VQATVGELGVSVRRLERNPDDSDVRDRLPQQLAGLASVPQAPLAPLLVWLALAVRPAPQSTWLAALSDNLIAWRAARRALRGRFRLA